MQPNFTRRDVLRGSVAFAATVMARTPLAALGFPEPEAGSTPVPFVTPQIKSPNRPMVHWDALTDWQTDNASVYVVSHYNKPELAADEWRLNIAGFVERPATFTLAELKQRPRRELLATLECGGNGASPTFLGAAANVRWTGTPLAPLLKECGLKKRGLEVAFFGADQKQEKVREQEFEMRFSRSLALGDALRDDVLLCWEMNGQPLPREHGFPLRLVVPGWYGIAWIKWLTRIEVLDRRLMSKYMGREYVTIRGEDVGGQTLWRETSVSFMNVKSVVARVLRLKDGTLRVSGAAWSDGTPIQSVELKLDDGPWQSVKLDTTRQSKYSWTFWWFDWKNAPVGEHTLVSRATDADGRVQPAPDDPAIKLKKTYWEANQQWPRKIRI